MKDGKITIEPYDLRRLLYGLDMECVLKNAPSSVCEREAAGTLQKCIKRIRKEKTLPVLDEYFKWIRSFDPDHIIKGKLRDGIVYSQN